MTLRVDGEIFGAAEASIEEFDLALEVPDSVDLGFDGFEGGILASYEGCGLLIYGVVVVIVGGDEVVVGRVREGSGEM